MRVEIVEEPEGDKASFAFPRGRRYLDLRADPKAVDRIAAARQFLPLRNFLVAVNGAESIFTSASAGIKGDSPAAISSGAPHEFAFEAMLVFAESALNFERKQYRDLTSSLKELLERDTADSVHVLLRISICDFSVVQRRGFSLGVRLVAEGDSPQQAEMRCGLALARLQQALLFRARSLKQQTTAG
jgi:hypothetical protein